MPRLEFHVRPNEPYVDPAILLQIGRAVSYWGRVEYILDGDIHHMWLFPAGQALRGEMPLVFKKRLKLWSRLFRAVCHDRPEWLERASKLRERMTEVAPLRHVLTHSFWGGFEDADADSRTTVHLINLKEENGRIIERRYRFTAGHIEEHATELADIYFQLVTLSATRMFTLGTPIPPRS